MRKKTKKVTRREWLLKLGESAVLVGCGGNLWEETSSARLDAAHALPPGLYEPSYEPLRHSLESHGRFRAIAAGSPTDFARPHEGAFRPQFFAEKEYVVVRKLVEIMLGEPHRPVEQMSVVDEVAEWLDLAAQNATETREASARLSPEHRALAAAYYGAEGLQELNRDDLREPSREALAWLDSEAQRRYGKDFLKLLTSEQVEVLQSLNGQNGGPRNRFFNWIKKETISGFYTSRTGLKELNYKGNAFYSSSPGCPHSSHQDS